MEPKVNSGVQEANKKLVDVDQGSLYANSSGESLGEESGSSYSARGLGQVVKEDNAMKDQLGEALRAENFRVSEGDQRFLDHGNIGRSGSYRIGPDVER